MQLTLGIAIVLVIMVIFLFLRSAAATVIPALALPISLIGTFAAMYVLGYSINNMSLLALTLSVGFVVDDAIVMLENIVRHIEGGMRPFEAALKGSREIGFTILSITFSLIAVFIPVLFMGGIVGRVFREFAVTITIAILVSGFVSLTLTPMLCARVLKAITRARARISCCALFEAHVRSWLRGYEVIARPGAQGPSFVMLLVTLATLVGTVRLYIVVPKGSSRPRTPASSPARPRGRGHFLQGDVGAQQQVADIICARIRRWITSIPRSVPAAPTRPPITAAVHRAQAAGRAQGNSTAVIQRLRARPIPFPAWRPFSRTCRTSISPAASSKSEYQYTLQSSDTETLYSVGPNARQDREDPGAARRQHRSLHQESADDDPDRPRDGGGLGVTVDQIRQELYNGFGTRQVATIYTPINDYQVILESDPNFQADPTGLSKLFVKTNLNGQATAAAPRARSRSTVRPADRPGRAASAVTKIVPSVGPLQVNHQGQQPSVTISFNLAPGYRARRRRSTPSRPLEREAHLPATIVDRLPGLGAGVPGFAARAGRAGAGGGLRLLHGARHPLRELHPPDHHHLRPAVGRRRRAAHADDVQDGPFGHRHDRHRDAGRHRQEERHHDDRFRDRSAARVGMAAEEAIREACLLRFRPIMMTTFAAIFGALPIALGAGAGAELRQPLGVAVVGGLLVSQLLTLYITPVIYIYLDKLDRMLKRRLEPPVDLREAHEPQGPHAVAAE